MNYPVFVRVDKGYLDCIEIYIKGTGLKIIGFSHKYTRLTIHKFKYHNKNSLLRKLNSKLIYLNLVTDSYDIGWVRDHSNTNLWSTWSSCSTDEEEYKPNDDNAVFWVDITWINRIKLDHKDKQFLKICQEKVYKQKNPSKEPKDPFKYRSRYQNKFNARRR